MPILLLYPVGHHRWMQRYLCICRRLVSSQGFVIVSFFSTILPYYYYTYCTDYIMCILQSKRLFSLTVCYHIEQFKVSLLSRTGCSYIKLCSVYSSLSHLLRNVKLFHKSSFFFLIVNKTTRPPCIFLTFHLFLLPQWQKGRKRKGEEKQNF